MLEAVAKLRDVLAKNWVSISKSDLIQEEKVKEFEGAIKQTQTDIATTVSGGGGGEREREREREKEREKERERDKWRGRNRCENSGER